MSEEKKKRGRDYYSLNRERILKRLRSNSCIDCKKKIHRESKRCNLCHSISLSKDFKVRKKLSLARKGKTWEEIYGLKKEEVMEMLNIHNPKRIRKIKMLRAKQKIPNKDTSIELRIQDLLGRIGVEFYTHHYIEKIKYSYRCDIFIPVQEGISQKTIIECDGDYWHGNLEIYNLSDLSKRIKQSRCLDFERTAQLEEKGFKVIRLWENKIKEMGEGSLKGLICR